MAGYGDDAGFAAWLAANGYTVTAPPAPAVLRERGSTYVDAAYGLKFIGSPTDGIAQERAWPRSDASAYGTEIEDDAIPSQVVKASYFAAYISATNPSLLTIGTSGNRVIKREKVEGAVDVEYFENKGDASYGAFIRFPYLDGLLAPLLGTAQDGIYGAVLIV